MKYNDFFLVLQEAKANCYKTKCIFQDTCTDVPYTKAASCTVHAVSCRLQSHRNSACMEKKGDVPQPIVTCGVIVQPLDF